MRYLQAISASSDAIIKYLGSHHELLFSQTLSSSAFVDITLTAGYLGLLSKLMMGNAESIARLLEKMPEIETMLFEQYIRAFNLKLGKNVEEFNHTQVGDEQSHQHDESFTGCLKIYSDQSLIKAGKADQHIMIESHITKVLQSALWTLSNMYAESQISDKALSVDKIV